MYIITIWGSGLGGLTNNIMLMMVGVIVPGKMHYSEVYYSTMQYTTVHYSRKPQCTTAQYSTLQYDKNIVQFTTV